MTEESDRDALMALFGKMSHVVAPRDADWDEPWFEVADDVSLRYYDGGTEVDREALVDKILTWLTGRDDLIRRDQSERDARIAEEGYIIHRPDLSVEDDIAQSIRESA